MPELEKTLLEELWQEKIKPWLDLRTFLQQRKEMRLIPEYMIATPEKDKDKWKSPLSFALQALTMQVVISSVLLSPLLLFPRTLANSIGLPTGVKAKQIQPPVGSFLPFEPMWSNYDKFLKALSETIPDFDEFTQAIALAASAYAFGKLLGRRADTVSNDHAERVLLYFVPAVTFTPNVLHSITIKLSNSLKKIDVPMEVYAPYVNVINLLLFAYFFYALYRSRSMLDVLFLNPSANKRKEAYWLLVKVIVIVSILTSSFIFSASFLLVYAKLLLGELAE